MSERRKMMLFRINSDGTTSLIMTKLYEFTTLAYERQIADDFAADYGYRQGDGYIAIVNPKTGGGLNKLDLQP